MFVCVKLGFIQNITNVEVAHCMGDVPSVDRSKYAQLINLPCLNLSQISLDYKNNFVR